MVLCAGMNYTIKYPSGRYDPLHRRIDSGNDINLDSNGDKNLIRIVILCEELCPRKVYV